MSSGVIFGESVVGDPVPSSAISDATVAGLSFIVMTGGSAGDIPVRQSDGTYLPTAPSAASGDVVGPASATDNAIARFDATTGKLLQNCVVTIGDTGNIAGLGTVSCGAITSTGNLNFCTDAGFTQSGSSIDLVRAGMDNFTLRLGGFVKTIRMETTYGRISCDDRGGFALDNGVAITSDSSRTNGVLEINNGTAGTLRDLVVRNFRMASPTLVPASAAATGSAGQIAWDTDYLYVCVATNTWKRVAIATW